MTETPSPHRAARATPDACRPPDPRAVRPGDRLALRRADDLPAAGDQHLSADLDDPAVSFTNFQANRPNREVEWVGLRNYERILTDTDIWLTMQATAHFLFWTIFFQVLIGFTLAWLINRKFKGNDLLDHDHRAADDAVAGGGGQFLDIPLPAADRPVQLRRLVLHRRRSVSLRDARIGQSGALVHRHRRHLDVDALRDADLPGRAALDPGLHL